MPPLSPRMQQFQGGMSQGPDQATSLFESGLSEMAYQLLTQQIPDLVPDVVTFKVLATDVDKGYGVGAFVVSRGGQPIYVPVVMSNSAIKPLEVMYHKALNMFLPLNKGWLDELDKAGLASLGAGVKTPETLYTDVDIRNIVVPPITGRFSYASWQPKAEIDVARVLSSANLTKEGDAREPSMLLPLLHRAPNRVKAAFQRVLEHSPTVLKAAAAAYGMSALSAALRPGLEKVAAKQAYGGALWIADKDTTPSEFRRVFGDKAGEAYAGVRRDGYAAKDDRLNHNLALQVQPYERWIEPNQPGVYVLYDSSATEHPALVIPDPIDVLAEGPRYGRRPIIPGRNPLIQDRRDGVNHRGASNKVYPMGRPDESNYVTRRGWNAPKYLAVLSNGDYIEPDRLVGRDSVADALSGAVHKRLFVDVSGEPRAGKGFFVRQKGTTFQATVPIEIKSVTTGSDGVRRVKAGTPGGLMSDKTIVTDPRSGYGSIWMPQGSDIVYIPPDFVWVPLKECLPSKAWFQSAMDLAACVSSTLASVGAKKVSIKDAGARQFSIEGKAPMNRVPAIRKIATDYGIKVADACAMLAKAAGDGHAYVWIATPGQIALAQVASDKLAADESDDRPKKRKPPEGGQGTSSPPSEPDLASAAAQAAMGPTAPPPPLPPSPVELAAMEMDQALQAEMQKLQDKQQMLATLVQRSHEIAGGAPMAASAQTQAMGAPPSSMNLATGQPMDPGMMGPGMDPGAGTMPPGMDPGAGTMPPGMDPGAGTMPSGTMPDGMTDPQAGGAMPPGMLGGPGVEGMPPGMPGQPGMDPSMSQVDPSMVGGPPPGAMMPVDGPNSHAFESEVNPQFLQQAGALPSDVFDAAAVATLVQSPALHAVVGQHLPNLEKAVDNLARVLLTLWMQESDLKERVGETTFDGIEQNLSSTFKSMGDIVLRLARGVQGAKDPDGHASP
jgi:hypothetical protein